MRVPTNTSQCNSEVREEGGIVDYSNEEEEPQLVPI
jgi:hypothetical protein